MLDKKYDQLTPSQRQAVFHRDGPMLVIAGPGSGKTRVITYRIAALIDSGIKPFNICAITFTNKAAEEMRKRAFKLGTSAGTHISTFHSLCVRILRRYAEQAEIKTTFSIYDASDQTKCIRQAIKDCDLDTSRFTPSRMLHAVSTLKNNLEGPDSFAGSAEDFFSKNLARIYAQYQQTLTRNNALDFDDLLMKTALLLRGFPDICAELGNRFRYLLVDEYQDTNHAQYIIAKAIASTHNNICVTGDPDQSIYRWRGADIKNILAFETDWPDATVIKLEQNFRSTPNILRIADNLIAANQMRKEKTLIPTRDSGRDVLINSFDDQTAEASGVVTQIKKLIDRGSSLKDIAIFYRVNAMSRPLEEALVRNRIPYQIIRGIEFYNRKEIRDMIAYMKVLVNPDDQTALLRIINTPARGIGKTTIDRVRFFADSRKITFLQALRHAANIDSLPKATKAKIAVFINLIGQFEKLISNNSVKNIAEKIFTDSGMEKALQAEGPDGKNAIENVAELINSASQYDKQSTEPSLIDYLHQISLFSDTDTYDPTSQRVALMTLHAAKGLEFTNVFIIGVEDGILPHERSADYDEEIEEERRLFFVGITRTKTDLHISYCKYRTIRAMTSRTVPSQFLYELGISFNSRENQYDYQDQTNYNDNFDYTDDIPAADDHAEPAPSFVINQLVGHRKFGLGRVKKFTDIGQNSTVVVKFNTGQTKTLMVKYAKLLKL